jgi:hypothetical protein
MGRLMPTPTSGADATEPTQRGAQAVDSAGVGALTMVEAKKGLALTLGMRPEAIEITIRG